MTNKPNTEESDFNWLELPIPKLLELKADAHPQNRVIETPTYSITYEELNWRANTLADELAKLDSSTKYVAVFSSDFVDTLVGFFGLLKADKIVILLDPSAPQQALTEILKTVNCSTIASSSEDIHKARELLKDRRTQSSVIPIASKGDPKPNPAVDNDLDAPAIVMFTSGSTGRPKGVIKSHRFIMHDLLIRAEKYQMTSSDRVMITNDLFFARTLFTSLSTIFGDATLVLIDVKKEGINVLPAWLSKNHITIFSPTGSMLRGINVILKEEDTLPDLRIIRIGAEAVYGRDLTNIKNCISDNCLIWVNYGSTETGSICCFLFNRHQHIPEGLLPVGLPFTNKEIQIIDDQGNEMKQGDTGEVVVKSKFISSGYLDKTLSDGKYYTDDQGVISYLTNDRGRIRTNGMLELSGRADQMIKIRGFRVDLSHVESHLNELKEVIEGVITVLDNALTVRLVGHVVLDQNQGHEAIKEQLSERIPAYMIPSQFIEYKKLPKLSNGKIDRKKLSETPSYNEVQPNYQPTNELEDKIRTLWIEALGHNDFGLNDSFFDRGGDSIGGAVLISELEKAFDVELASDVFWEDPTISGIIETIKLKKHGSMAEKVHKDQLLHRITEQLKSPDGRLDLILKRTYRQRISETFRKVGRAIRKGQFFSYLSNQTRKNFYNLIVGRKSYSRTADMLSKWLNMGLASLFISKSRRKRIDLFNQIINPNITDQERKKSYLFFLLYTTKMFAAIRKAIATNGYGKFKITVEGQHHIDEAQRNGRGVVLVGYHTLANQWLSSLHLDVMTIGNIDGLLRGYGLSNHKTAVYASILETALERLKHGGIVKFTGDGKEGSGKHYVYEVGGFKRKYFTGFAELAIRSNAQVVPITSYMSTAHEVVIRFGDPFTTKNKDADYTEQVHHLMDQFAQMLDSQVRVYPWQVSINHILTTAEYKKKLKKWRKQQRKIKKLGQAGE